MDKRTKAGLTRQIERNLISSWERKKGRRCQSRAPALVVSGITDSVIAPTITPNRKKTISLPL